MSDRPKLPDLPLFCRGPFYLNGAMWICGTDEYGGCCHIADIRGWGYLTGHGMALALSGDEAFKAQKKNRRVDCCINERGLGCTSCRRQKGLQYHPMPLTPPRAKSDRLSPCHGIAARWHVHEPRGQRGRIVTRHDPAPVRCVDGRRVKH